MKTDCGEIKTIQIDEYIIPNAIDMIIGARESRKISSIVATLWNHIMYKKYRTRISHITHTRRKICQRKK